jgi:hypothetical protein
VQLSRGRRFARTGNRCALRAATRRACARAWHFVSTLAQRRCTMSEAVALLVSNARHMPLRRLISWYLSPTLETYQWKVSTSKSASASQRPSSLALATVSDAAKALKSYQVVASTGRHGRFAMACGAEYGPYAPDEGGSYGNATAPLEGRQAFPQVFGEHREHITGVGKALRARDEKPHHLPAIGFDRGYQSSVARAALPELESKIESLDSGKAAQRD